jgi:hypothetical protein
MSSHRLYQKAGGIEALPSVVLQLVQKFVHEKEYRHLVNSNLASFQSVKYETVHLSLKISRRLDPIKELKVIQLIDSVKDKSKQISISFVRLFPAIMKYSQIYFGVGGKLKKLTQYWENYMEEKRDVHFSIPPALSNFSFCQNIYSLKLVGLSWLDNCQGIGNIHSLTIEHCPFITTTAGLGIVTGKIRLKSCGSLVTLEGLLNIPEVEISYCEKVHELTSIGNHNLFRVQYCPLLKKLFKKYQNNGKHAEIFNSIQLVEFLEEKPKIFNICLFMS